MTVEQRNKGFGVFFFEQRGGGGAPILQTDVVRVDGV